MNCRHLRKGGPAVDLRQNVLRQPLSFGRLTLPRTLQHDHPQLDLVLHLELVAMREVVRLDPVRRDDDLGRNILLAQPGND